MTGVPVRAEKLQQEPPGMLPNVAEGLPEATWEAQERPRPENPLTCLSFLWQSDVRIKFEHNGERR